MFPPLNSTVQTSHQQLRDAAQAVCDRWDSPDWGKLEHTGDYIRRLRLALDYDAAAAAPAAESPMQTALRRLLREYIYTRTMDGTSAEDCETMECVKAARAALAGAKAEGSAS